MDKYTGNSPTFEIEKSARPNASSPSKMYTLEDGFSNYSTYNMYMNIIKMFMIIVFPAF